MTIEYVTGDLLKSDEIHIAHGCNTVGVMGAGVARVIAEAYPVVRSSYQRACVEHRFVIGSAQPVLIPGIKRDRPAKSTKPVTVWNLGTQREPGPDATLWGIMLSFGNMMEQMMTQEIYRVAIPRIGCGIGGLAWDQVEATISLVQSNVGPKAPLVVVYTQASEAHKSW